MSYLLLAALCSALLFYFCKKHESVRSITTTVPGRGYLDSVFATFRNTPPMLTTTTTPEPITTKDPTPDSSSRAGWNVQIFHMFDGCTNFNWISRDHFCHTDATITDVSGHVPDTSFNWNNTQVFLVIPSTNSVMGTSPVNGNTPAFAAKNIPIGTPVKLIAIARKGTDYYYAEHTDLIVAANMSVDFSFVPKPLADIKARLADL